MTPSPKVYRTLESKQQQARLSSLSGPSSIWKQSTCHCRGQSWTQNLLRQRLFCSQSKGKRDRDTNVVHSLRETNILKRSLNGTLTWPFEEREAQQKLFQAEAEVETRNWDKRNFDFAFREINQEFESQRFQLHQASRWADQAQRDKISSYG